MTVKVFDSLSRLLPERSVCGKYDSPVRVDCVQHVTTLPLTDSIVMQHSTERAAL